jgi:hypothetical protein
MNTFETSDSAAEIAGEMTSLGVKWDVEKQQYMILTRGGGLVEPTVNSAIKLSIGALILPILGAFVPNDSKKILYLGFFMSAIFLYGAIVEFFQFFRYRAAKKKFDTEYSRLQAQLDRVCGQASY